MGHEQGDSVHSRALNVVPERDGIFGGLGVHPQRRGNRTQTGTFSVVLASPRMAQGQLSVARCRPVDVPFITARPRAR